jgi:hypothetical protein
MGRVFRLARRQALDAEGNAVTTGSNWIRTTNPIRNGESARFENISRSRTCLL